MKAIAFAIICAAYLLVPSAEFNKAPEWMKGVHFIVFMFCIMGFWVNIFTEK